MQLRLKSKVAVVTGGASGLGRLIAEGFANEGASLVICDRDEAVGNAMVEELRDTGTVIRFVPGDIGAEETADALAECVREQFGHLDVLMLNAGTAIFGNYWEATPDEFDRIMRTNVRGAWLAARACRGLLRPGASVIAMGSVSSFIAFPGETIYSISKGAVLQLVRGMASDLASSHVRANALCPGPVGRVGMQQRALSTSTDVTAGLAEIEAMTPLGRLAEPEEIVEGALFLASGDSSFMTGATLVIDGGMVMH